MIELDNIEGHIHLFDKNDIAEGALGSKLLYRAVNKHTVATAYVLHNLIPYTSKDALDKLKNFIVYEKKTQLQKLEIIKKLYPTNTKFNVLTINQHYLEGGKVGRKYEDQLKEVIALKVSKEPINIFYFSEPRCPENFSMLLKYEKHISGLKMYPNWGYFPYDSRLTTSWDWANRNGKPIIFHCTEDAIINYQGDDIDYLLKESKFPLNKCKNRKEKAGNFANPKGIAKMAIKYPNAKVNAAHLGGVNAILGHLKGEHTYTTDILHYCKSLPNFYTDISFCAYDEVVQQFIKTLLIDPILKHKILFGSDFYMNQAVAFQEDYTKKLKSVIGIQAFNQMIKINNNLFYNS